jgi:hypothetical protein
VTETTPTQDGRAPRSGPAILDASRLMARDGDVARTHRRGGRRPPWGGQDQDLPVLAWRFGTEAWAIDLELPGLKRPASGGPRPDAAGAPAPHRGGLRPRDGATS